jgi:hypothetical protein
VNKIKTYPKPINVMAKSLRLGQFQHRVVPDKKKYSRKGRPSSTRKFEDSIQLANGRELIEL